MPRPPLISRDVTLPIAVPNGASLLTPH